MTFLKRIGLALLAAFVTVLAFFGGFVFSVVSSIVTVILTVAGVFTLVFYLLWEPPKDSED